MTKRNLSIKVQSLKPRNPMGSVKMTGGGKHVTSKKTLRQDAKKQIKNCLSFGRDSNNKGSYQEPLVLMG